MIMNMEEVEARLTSPDNLMNRLRRTEGENRARSVSLPPPIDDLVDDIEAKLDTKRSLTGAAAVMAQSIALLQTRLPDVDRPEKLARIASDMSKIINGENDKQSSQKTFNQVIVYKPIVVSESSFGDAIIAVE